MIDTVGYYFDTELPLKPGGDLIKGRNSLDDQSGLRAWCSGTGITRVEVSLPRLLFPNNSHPIQSQAQLDKALAKADEILAQFAVFQEQKRIFHRVDLVWNFAKDPQRMFLAHEHCNHPEVHTKVAAYRNLRRPTGLEWIGAYMTIKMYDKTNRQLERPRPLTRVEIELKGRVLQKKLGHGGPVEKLDFALCYKEYRKVVTRFKPKDVPILSDKDDAIFFAELQGVRLIDALTQTMSEDSIRDLKRRQITWVWKKFKVDWDSLLPITTPPFPWHAGVLKPKCQFTFKR